MRRAKKHFLQWSPADNNISGYALIDYLLPLYHREGKSQLVIAFGCTGGKHRSVTLAEELAKHVGDGGHRVIVHHRDIAKL